MVSSIASDPAIIQAGLDPSALLAMYRCMLLSRAVDLRAWSLSRQGRAHFVITSRGHEAAEVGSAFALDRGRDYVLPYYRSLALALGIGMTPHEVFLGIFARARGTPCAIDHCGTAPVAGGIAGSDVR